jgi:hypothetical protein
MTTAPHNEHGTITEGVLFTQEKARTTPPIKVDLSSQGVRLPSVVP